MTTTSFVSKKRNSTNHAAFTSAKSYHLTGKIPDGLNLTGNGWFEINDYIAGISNVYWLKWRWQQKRNEVIFPSKWCTSVHNSSHWAAMIPPIFISTAMGKELNCVCSLFNIVKGLFNIERWEVDCPWMSGSAAVLRLVDGTKLVDLLLQEFDRGILGPR